MGLVLLLVSGVLVYRWGWKALYVLVPVVAVQGAYFSLSVEGFSAEFITMVVSPMVVGAVGGYSFKTKRSYQFFMTVSTLPLVLVLSLNYYGLKVFKNQDLVLQSKDRLVALLKTAEMSEEEKADLLKKVDSSIEMLGGVMPFTYFLNTLFVALLGYVLLKFVLFKYMGRSGDGTDGIAYFKMSDYLIFVLIAAWAAVLLADREKLNGLFLLGLNTALIFSVFYLVQAVGIVKYYLLKKNLPPFILPAGILGLLLLGVEAILFVSVVLLSIGAIDFWADFRKLETHVKE